MMRLKMFATYSTLFERNAPLTVSSNARTVNTAYSNMRTICLCLCICLYLFTDNDNSGPCFVSQTPSIVCVWLAILSFAEHSSSNDYVYYSNVICVILVLSAVPCIVSALVTLASQPKAYWFERQIHLFGADSIFIVIGFVVYWISQSSATWGRKIIRAIMRRNGTKRRTHYNLQSLRVPRSCTSQPDDGFEYTHSQGCNC